ncbi:ABC transporter substrate-binding protein [Nocardia yamanashiensis]|uniref:ABC transporter substrate-binding protein n=1 Tax=Nocardia yamanashiensis TaxID=209247 RepID=UPI0008363C42|nr:sugar ABC transporter substrate-binding protein [Nocardia yamanashiensis]
MVGKPFGRRSFLRGAGALSVAGSLLPAAACGDDDQALTFFFQANPEEAKGRMAIIDEFRRRCPEIAVRTVLSGPDPMQQMSTYCAGGKCPDVLMAWDLTFAGLADRGMLLDLNTMLASDPAFAAELRTESVGALYETFEFEGGQYAFPEQWAGNFLFYNKKLFSDAGVPAPPARWDRPWSFDEFLSAARALTKRNRSGKVTQWGFVDTWVPYYSAGLFGMNNGAVWSAPRINPAHINFDDPAFIDGVQFYADLSNKHAVTPTPADRQSMSTMDMFVLGKAAMAMGGHWRYGTFTHADDLDLDVTVLPTGPKCQGALSNIGTTGLAIAASSPRRQQAWEFVKFVTGPVGQALIGGSGLFVPVLKSALNSPGFAKAHARVGNLAVLTEGPARSGFLPVTPVWAEIDALMDRSFGPVLRGTKPATVLTGLSRDVDEVLRKL